MVAWKVDEDPSAPAATPADLVNAQYAGAKSALRPIYDLLAKEIEGLGEAVLDPRQTYVSVIRRRQIAVIQASTKTRVDLGLALAGVAPDGKLQLAKSSLGSDRITHRVALGSPDDVDAEVIRWLRAAYEADS
jgi:hypothetical protein